jgi:SAM-dependent methyltransferase
VTQSRQVVGVTAPSSTARHPTQQKRNSLEDKAMTTTTDNNRAGSPDEIRAAVSEGYARIAEEASSCCAPKRGVPSCCGGADVKEATSLKIGYTPEELGAVPEGANLGLGCGNPTAIDALEPGEVVVDLGSGGGLDCFLAAQKVGPTGRVIGVDMTDAMLATARRNAAEGKFDNVEFRKGTIEDLPIEDGTVDVIISNCVINLSPEKPKVFGEAFRVLRPGGRLVVSDIVLERPLPENLAMSLDAYLGCVGGASQRADYLRIIEEAGFEAIQIQRTSNFGALFQPDDPAVIDFARGANISMEELLSYSDAITSLQYIAVKPS